MSHAEFDIPLDVFNIRVGVFFRDEDRVAALASEGVATDPSGPAAKSTAHRDIGPDGRAWFSMVIKPGASMATWTHECVHIADWVMDYLNIPTGAENTEVRGYLVGHLFQGLRDNIPEGEA